MLFVMYLSICLLRIALFFFFKQKTAYELRISDWSSDVCSSDLAPYQLDRSSGWRLTWKPAVLASAWICSNRDCSAGMDWLVLTGKSRVKIGRASCRERVCQYV